MSSGLKADAIELEQAVGSHGIPGAVVFGTGRDRLGIPIDCPLETSDEQLRCVERSRTGGAEWRSSIVARVNEPVPPAKCIDERLIIRVRADRPLPRTVKQTIPRSLAVQLYAAEIEAAYAGLSI